MNTKSNHKPDQHRPTPPGIESKMDPRPQFRGQDYQPANKLKDKVALITEGDVQAG